ncbi:uncharacterized protein LOC143036999 [Oratosquilla oratoria]|uniref:uncharacterized protein LOC143036999 n=1 Tax=Oratosquilla oratoria TaxID=337810 RepID=UPI003F75AB35
MPRKERLEKIRNTTVDEEAEEIGGFDTSAIEEPTEPEPEVPRKRRKMSGSIVAQTTKSDAEINSGPVRVVDEDGNVYEKRRPNFTHSEVQMLYRWVMLFEETCNQPHVTNSKRDLIWRTIAAKVNEVGPYKRTGHEVSKKWQNMRNCKRNFRWKELDNFHTKTLHEISMKDQDLVNKVAAMTDEEVRFAINIDPKLESDDEQHVWRCVRIKTKKSKAIGKKGRPKGTHPNLRSSRPRRVLPPPPPSSSGTLPPPSPGLSVSSVESPSKANCSSNPVYAQRLLQNLWRSHDFTDATVMVESCSFPVHKAVLAEVSPYFRQVFWSAKEAQNTVFVLPGVAVKTVSQLIQYIYTGEVTLQMHDIPELLQCAKLLKVESLVDCLDTAQNLPPSERNANISTAANTSDTPVQQCITISHTMKNSAVPKSSSCNTKLMPTRNSGNRQDAGDADKSESVTHHLEANNHDRSKLQVSAEQGSNYGESINLGSQAHEVSGASKQDSLDTSQQSIDSGQRITLSAAYVRGQSCNSMYNMRQDQQESLMNLQPSVGLGPEMFEGVEGSEGEDEDDEDDDDGDSDEEMTGP